MKERLVGAAVLVAAAVILIPEMLSGPPTSTQPATADAGGETPVRTVTIDFSRNTSADAPPEPQIVEEPAPPPEETPQAEAPAEVAAVEPAVPPRPATGSELPVNPNVTPSAPPVTTAAAEREPSPRAGPWAVQVGSFANRATADALRQKLTQDGYTTFVVPFKSNTQTLYRVRVGPMQERSEADATVQKLKRAGTGATVVSN